MALASPMHLPTKYNKPHLAERALLGLLIMPLSVFVYPWAAERRYDQGDPSRLVSVINSATEETQHRLALLWTALRESSIN